MLLALKVATLIMESAITVKGQATIPKAIREHLGLRPGDRVKFFVHPDGSVVSLGTRAGCSCTSTFDQKAMRLSGCESP
jgi:AbrB family looped-hinge helix DNA binding protein